jgi:hypothetical protein
LPVPVALEVTARLFAGAVVVVTLSVIAVLRDKISTEPVDRVMLSNSGSAKATPIALVFEVIFVPFEGF